MKLKQIKVRDPITPEIRHKYEKQIAIATRDLLVKYLKRMPTEKEFARARDSDVIRRKAVKVFELFLANQNKEPKTKGYYFNKAIPSTNTEQPTKCPKCKVAPLVFIDISYELICANDCGFKCNREDFESMNNKESS